MLHAISKTAVLRTAVLLAALLALLAAVVVTSTSQAEAQTGDVTITVLHNNDGESKLIADADGGFPGIARFVQAMKDKQAASTADGVITLTSGDNFLASKEFNASLESGTFFDAVALSGLYDAMALGNHDFDFGPDVAADFVSAFDPPIPFLSANADFSAEPALAALVASGQIAPSTVIEVAGTQVGVIGAVTPQLPNISSPRGVVISADVAAAVNAQVAALEAAGVNKIILVSHLQGVDEDVALIPLLDGVDIVIAGGGDELLANDGDTCAIGDVAGPYPTLVADSDGTDVPVITGPGGYRCIGQLDVTFNSDGEITATSGGAMAVALDGAQDADVLANVEEPIVAAVAALESNVVASLKVPLDGQRSSVRTTASNEGSLLSDALLDAGQRLGPDFGVTAPVVAIQNGGGIRNDAIIPAGDFTEADTFDIAPFSNFVVVMDISRETFKEMLENAYNRLPDAGGSFAQPAGFTVTLDMANPAREINRDGDCELTGDPGSRVVDVTLDDGTKIVENGAVVPGPDLSFTTIDFLARGGDCYPLGDISFTALGISYQRALAEYASGTLGGNINATQYPAEGTGRVIITDSVLYPSYPSQPDPTPTAVPAPVTPLPTAIPVVVPQAPAPTPIVVPAPAAAPAPVVVVVAPTPIVVVAPAAVSTGSSMAPAVTTNYGFGTSVPASSKNVPLAHTGTDTHLLSVFALGLLGAGFVIMGSRRRMDG